MGHFCPISYRDTSHNPSLTMKITAAALIISSVLLQLCQTAPTIAGGLAIPAVAIGGTTVVGAATLPYWLLALKAGLLGKAVLLNSGVFAASASAGAAGGLQAGRAAAERDALVRQNNFYRTRLQRAGYTGY